jgi:hypothetical protein
MAFYTESDAVMLIAHSAKQGVPFEEYLRGVARSSRAKIAKVSMGLKSFEDTEDI